MDHTHDMATYYNPGFTASPIGDACRIDDVLVQRVYNRAIREDISRLEEALKTLGSASDFSGLTLAKIGMAATKNYALAHPLVPCLRFAAGLRIEFQDPTGLLTEYRHFVVEQAEYQGLIVTAEALKEELLNRLSELRFTKNGKTLAMAA